MCLERLRICIIDIQEWFKANKLVINDNKTEYIPFIPKRYDSLVATSSIRVGDDIISASTHVTNLGVILNRHYTMSQQVSKIVQSSTYKLRLINVIRTKLTKPVAGRVVNVMVTNNLDYFQKNYMGFLVTNFCEYRVSKTLQLDWFFNGTDGAVLESC